jgi:hypothetical protein
MSAPKEVAETDGVETNYDDVNTPMIAMIAALSAIITLAVIIAIQAFFFQYQETLVKDRVVDQKTDTAQSMLTEQLQSVSEYGVVDKAAGVYAIPIDRAMEIVVEDLNKDREEQSGNSNSDAEDSDSNNETDEGENT